MESEYEVKCIKKNGYTIKKGELFTINEVDVLTDGDLLEVSEDQESYVEEFARIVNKTEEEIFEKLQILHLVGSVIIYMITKDKI